MIGIVYLHAALPNGLVLPVCLYVCRPFLNTNIIFRRTNTNIPCTQFDNSITGCRFRRAENGPKIDYRLLRAVARRSQLHLRPSAFPRFCCVNTDCTSSTALARYALSYKLIMVLSRGRFRISFRIMRDLGGSRLMSTWSSASSCCFSAMITLIFALISLVRILPRVHTFQRRNIQANFPNPSIQ